MTRSLTFPYLFVVLAVSYVGGTLLFRELSEDSIGKIMVIFDPRVVNGHEANWFFPAVIPLLFMVIIFFGSRFTYSRFFVLFIAAIKCVLFGVSSAYLLAQGLKVYEYAIWWFPFQLLISFAILLFASIVVPPFFMRTIGKVARNNRALVSLFIFVVVLVMIENLLFFFFVH